jgi:[NiFe] hydrogenase diaphorase moiety large subunit
MKEKINSILDKYHNDRGRLVDILLEIQDMFQHIPEEAIGILAAALNLSKVDVDQTISFYHFLTKESTGKYAIYINNSSVAEMFDRAEIADVFVKEVGIPLNSVTEDGAVGLWETADIGMNDQEPAAIINGAVFPNLNPAKVKQIVKGIKQDYEVEKLVSEYGNKKDGPGPLGSLVENNLRLEGPVLFSDYEVGEALRKITDVAPEEVIEEVKGSNLRGRGGAGFPAGLKWDFCRKSGGDEVYLICNADEGEPGTFKERLILTELPKLLFEGMTIAGYAISAQQGILYLRYEYLYLKDYLEGVLQEMRELNLLGKEIVGKKDFDFDIRIQMGAGAYVCGEESGLIESMEGKRGEPRNRPPFPVEKGYLGKPTVVNNVETLCNVVKIVLEGAEWFKSFGTPESAGTKLLSISGDCEKPGIYEVEWGITVNKLLKMVGASNVQAVQVGGPSGTCINPSQFNQSIAFEDLATGGSLIVIGKDRDLLRENVMNFMDFFIEESCGSCGPCRSLTIILRDKLTKILEGDGTMVDIDQLYDWAQIGAKTNRCGLGQTSANPILTTIENFRNLYEDLVTTDQEYLSTFNMEEAVAESCEYVGRIPNIQAH